MRREILCQCDIAWNQYGCWMLLHLFVDIIDNQHVSKKLSASNLLAIYDQLNLDEKHYSLTTSRITNNPRGHPGTIQYIFSQTYRIAVFTYMEVVSCLMEVVSWQACQSSLFFMLVVREMSWDIKKSGPDVWAIASQAMGKLESFVSMSQDGENYIFGF